MNSLKRKREINDCGEELRNDPVNMFKKMVISDNRQILLEKVSDLYKNQEFSGFVDLFKGLSHCSKESLFNGIKTIIGTDELFCIVMRYVMFSEKISNLLTVLSELEIIKILEQLR